MKKNKQHQQNLAVLKNLHPQALWNHFAMLSAIPRKTHDETAVADYIVKIAKENKCDVLRDKHNNVLIRVKATEGWENHPLLCLQSHMDMVTVPKNNYPGMFPLKLELTETGELRAIGTTLGADNGIGLAAMLALVTEKNVQHGKLELLVTTVEEDGLEGAEKFDYSWLQSKTIVNLDSEEWGELFVGCAGGVVIHGSFVPTYINAPKGYTPYTIDVKGLLSGHSGLKIGLGRANAIKLLQLILSETSGYLHLVDISGGEKMNLIPFAASATVLIWDAKKDEFDRTFQDVLREINQMYPNESPQITYCESDINLVQVMDEESLFLLTTLIEKIPNGPLTLEPNSETLVQTSSNIGVVRTTDTGEVQFEIFSRSSVSLEIENVQKEIELFFKMYEGTTTVFMKFLPWEPQFDSNLVKYAVGVYKDTFNQEPKVVTIHAGLECALFFQKIPGVQLISFGPTIHGAHEIGEAVDVESVGEFWNFLCAFLVQ